MKNLLGNSSMPTYVKLMATGLLGCTYLSALAVATAEYITYGPSAQLPGIVTLVIGTGMGLALQILGLHTGAQLTENNPNTASGGTTNAGSSAT